MRLEVNVSQVHDVAIVHLSENIDTNIVPDAWVQEILTSLGLMPLLMSRKP